MNWFGNKGKREVKVRITEERFKELLTKEQELWHKQKEFNTESQKKIQREMKKEYKAYIGKWYLIEDKGVIFKILGIYTPDSETNPRFKCFFPNREENYMEISKVIEGVCKEVKKEDLFKE
tara:strand:+ start:1541 stop:1903 length:363 start_codon:yes stop_codon:yes gene_type:complete